MIKILFLSMTIFFGSHGIFFRSVEAKAEDKGPIATFQSFSNEIYKTHQKLSSPSNEGGGEQDDDAAGEGLNVDGAIGQFLRALPEYESKINDSSLAQIKKFGQQYMDNKKSCIDRHEIAAYACLEFLSPHILDGVTTLNTLASTVGGMAVKDKCDKFAGAMDMAKQAMTAYTAACGAAKMGCGSACTSSQEGLEKMAKAIGSSKAKCKDPEDVDCSIVKLPMYYKTLNKINENAQQELKPAQNKSVADKTRLCTEKYAQLLISAGSGIASLAKSMSEGQDCSDKTKGDTSQPQLANLNLAEKCKDPKNATLPECICEANPRTPGCANALQKQGEGNNGVNQLSAIGGDKLNSKEADRGVAGLGSDSGLPQIDHRNVNPDGGGAAGAPVGGGSAGLGGGAGSSGVPGSGNGESQGSGLDLDRYGTGFSGGGGGAGRYGNGDGSGSGSGKYRAYLPGGAKDPSKGLAGQQAWRNEVTGQGGKSNFEKISERYRDNKNTLLSN